MTWGVGGRSPACLPEVQTGLLSIPRTSLSASIYTRFANVRGSEEVVMSDDQFVSPHPCPREAALSHVVLSELQLVSLQIEHPS